jgi:hypothetical protein
MADGVRHRQDAPADDLSDYEDELLEDEDAFPPEPQPRADLDFEPIVFEPVSVAGPDAVRTVVTEAVEPPAEVVDDRVPEVDRTQVQDVVDTGEPGEEPTDASDLLVVAGLNAEVRVVDEHPRYHLATCVWLANRPTIPIPVSEARQLGFTPCSRCGPDSTLAARHRAGR